MRYVQYLWLVEYKEKNYCCVPCTKHDTWCMYDEGHWGKHDCGCW